MMDSLGRGRRGVAGVCYVGFLQDQVVVVWTYIKLQCFLSMVT